MEKTTEQKAFTITRSSGFQIKFPNGYTVSVQFGPGNYCDNYNLMWSDDGNKKAGKDGSNTAETALLDPDGNFVKYPNEDAGDDVQARMSPMDVLALMSYAAGLPFRKSVG